MTTNTTNAMPLSALQGTLSVHYAGKEEHECVLEERKIVTRELERAARCIDSMGELSLPFMNSSSRSASAVKDARLGASSRSVSAISNSKAAVGASSRSESPGAADPSNERSTSAANNNSRSSSPREDPQLRREALAVHSHELIEAAQAITAMPKNTLPGRKEIVGKKQQFDISSWVSQNVSTDEGFMELRRRQLEGNRMNDKASKHPPNRIGFRKLQPLWNKDQHDKHHQTKVAKLSSPLHADDETGVLATPAWCETDMKRRALAEEQQREHQFDILRFKYVCPQQKETDKLRSQRNMKREREAVKPERKPITFQTPRCCTVVSRSASAADGSAAAGVSYEAEAEEATVEE